MKTKTSQKRKRYGKAHPSPRRSADDRGLNEDDQKTITNTEAEGDDRKQFPENEVEAEEERERRRKVEDARGIENES